MDDIILTNYKKIDINNNKKKDIAEVLCDALDSVHVDFIQKLNFIENIENELKKHHTK
jgi:hypothetical protein